MKFDDQNKLLFFDEAQSKRRVTSKRPRDTAVHHDYAEFVTENQMQDSLVRLERKSNQRLDAINKRAEDAQKKFADELKDSTAEIASVKKENVAFRAKQIETIGIMVGLFTFISIQVQIFSNVNPAFFLPISMFFFAALLLFIVVMSIVNMVRIDDLDKAFYVPVVGLGAISLALVALSVHLYMPALKKIDQCEVINSSFTTQLSDNEIEQLKTGNQKVIDKIERTQLKAELLGCR